MYYLKLFMINDTSKHCKADSAGVTKRVNGVGYRGATQLTSYLPSEDI